MNQKKDVLLLADEIQLYDKNDAPSKFSEK